MTPEEYARLVIQSMQAGGHPMTSITDRHRLPMLHRQARIHTNRDARRPCFITRSVPAEVPQLKTLLAPYPSDEMICWPVSARVGNVKNNDPSLIEPIAAAG